ncbi:MAG TPA: endonuclease/exonuclease/phosphatase family protein [Patescibacteria group bacterium]|nr:endonuclease/exonuclease/phosphatase family protein [Patescibacteria group bacterium]
MLSLLSYNILFGNRLNHIITWIHEREEKNRPFDVLCFQEFPEKKISKFLEHFPGRNLAYQFSPAIMERKRTFGQLTVYNRDKLTLIKHHVLDLGKSPWENRLFSMIKKKKIVRNSLLTFFKNDTHEFVVANTHLTLVARNKYRISQLASIINHVNGTSRAIILGDFNYTSLLPRRRLMHLMERNDFRHATDRLKTHRIGFLKHQLDYIFYKNLSFSHVEVKRVNFSDHYPLLARFSP